MQKFSLPTQWSAQAVSNEAEVPANIWGQSIPAEVPGCIHLDLLRAELIPEPYLSENENLVQWIGRTDWEFCTNFNVIEESLLEERVDLVCEGLDTVATIWINGVQIGKSENMHVEYRFEAKDALKVGENEIKIRFDSAVLYARAMCEQLGYLPHANSYPKCEPFHFIRKNACNFGWDWGPALTTAGIWKNISIEAWSIARLKSVRPIVKVANENVAVVDIEVEVEYSQPTESTFDLIGRIGEEAADIQALGAGIDKATLQLVVREPNLWWPIGYGEQPLYDLSVELNIESTEPFAPQSWEAQIGLREVELNTTPDEYGAEWTIKINGKAIWCKGANWIPDDVFLPRANQPERLQTRLQQAAEAGMNMMRIWGGGIYETDEFYTICDQMGLLVWQDFLFACAAYSEETPMRELVEAEARFNVTRLSKHPSLVLWKGCNENIWGYFDWNWQEETKGRTWGAGYYFELLPDIVKELAPTTPYWAGSPYSGSMDIHPNSDQWGPKHMWDTWNQVNHTMFRSYSPRFASEFGHQSPPTYSTLQRAIPADQLNPFSSAMLLHQKASDGNKKLHDRLKEHFEMPEDFDDWLYLTQLMQARAMLTAVEWFRSRSVCSGALFWQLNDCWPVTSWAAIDGDGKPKPLYFAAQQFFGAQLLTIQPDGEHLALWAHNDTDDEWIESGEASLLNFDCETKKTVDFFVHVPARGLKKVAVLKDLAPENAQAEFIVAGTTSERAFWFFDIDKNLNYPEPSWNFEVEGSTLRIEAQTFVRDLCVFADRFGGTINEGLVTLLPGEVWEVEIEDADLTGVDFSQRPIVSCANYFGA